LGKSVSPVQVRERPAIDALIGGTGWTEEELARTALLVEEASGMQEMGGDQAVDLQESKQHSAP